MIVARSSTNGHINIYWLSIVQIANNGGGAGFAIECDRVEPSNYTVFIHDCSFNNSAVYNYIVLCLANGIIFWDDTFVGNGNNGLGGISFVCDKYGYTGPGSWNTPDTFGTADTTGLANSYVENCTFYSALFVSNFDDNSRIVWRCNTHHDAALSGHGQETSAFGSRAWEIYNNTFNCSSGNPMNLQEWFGCRGGTGVITGNSMVLIPYKSGIQLNVYSITRGMNDGAGGTFCPAPVGNGGYPAPRQTGWGWSASSNAAFGVGLDSNPSRLVGGTSPGVFAPLSVHRVFRERSNAKTSLSHKRYVHTRGPVTHSVELQEQNRYRFWGSVEELPANSALEKFFEKCTRTSNQSDLPWF